MTTNRSTACRILLLALAAVLPAACGDDSTTTDAAMRKDAGDAGRDAGKDGGVDARDGAGATDARKDAAPDALLASDVGAGPEAGGSDVAPVCPAPGPFVAPTVPPAITVPAGATLSFRTYAVGAQIYTCTGATAAVDGGTATTYSWVLKEPQATLYDDSCQAVGVHSAGPTWKWNADGSQVVGARVAGADSPVGAIPWLLLSAASHVGAGKMADVSYVQRVATLGGTAPANCTAAQVTQTLSVPYSATYYFFKGPVVALDAAVADAAPDRPADAPPACIPSSNLTPPTVPDDIKAPAGATLALKLRAEGSQIYTCTAIAPDADAGATTPTYQWNFKAPDARLFDTTCGEVVAHYAGPTWRWNADGSTVVGLRDEGVDSPSGWIPWLLLSAQSHAGTGVMSSITWIQRVDTVGGVEPPAGCNEGTAGTDQAVPYTANYYFYRGGTPDAPVVVVPIDAADDAPADAGVDAEVDAAPDAEPADAAID